MTNTQLTLYLLQCFLEQNKDIVTTEKENQTKLNLFLQNIKEFIFNVIFQDLLGYICVYTFKIILPLHKSSRDKYSIEQIYAAFSLTITAIVTKQQRQSSTILTTLFCRNFNLEIKDKMDGIH